jgi:hypothetical protein
MKTHIDRKVESFKASQMIPWLAPVVILLLFYSFRFSGVFAAILFTALVCSSPDSYRTRGGSLVPAVCLAAFVWLCAAVVFVLSFFGAH